MTDSRESTIRVREYGAHFVVLLVSLPYAVSVVTHLAGYLKYISQALLVLLL